MKGINRYLDPSIGDQLGLAIYPRYGNRSYKYNPRYRRSCGGWDRNWYFGQLEENLTADIDAINNRVANLPAEGYTPMASGTQVGREALFDPQHHQLDNVPILIVATDGMCNVILDGKKTGYGGGDPTGMGGCNALAEIQSIDQANLAKQEGAVLFTIAIGSDFAGDILKDMATAPAEDPNPYDDVNQAHFFQASNPQELAAIYDTIAKRVENIGDECIAKQIPAVPEGGGGARIELWKGGALASDEDGRPLQTTVGASGRFAFKKVPAGTYEVHATWTDENGLVYDIQTESLGGQPLEDPGYATVEVPEGTATLHVDVYLKTDDVPTCQ
jgi:hypothetical protein